MNYFDAYIDTIFLLKLIFMMLSLTHMYFNIKYPGEESDLDKKIVFWKQRVEFIFVFLMACLLIYLFFPARTKFVEINGETKLLFFIFGVVLLVTAKWGEFFSESRDFIRVQNILGANE
jgi:hypothetical protein